MHILLPTGIDLKVIFGAGSSRFGVPVEGKSNGRNDSRNLVTEWKREKELRKASAIYVKDNQEFRNLKAYDTDFILGKN